MFFCFFSFLFLDVIFALFIAQSGYPHLVSAWCKCFSSCCNSSGLEQMVLALWWRVPTTPYLDVIVWLLSHFRYWSVWVGFLYTVVFKVPSSLGVMRMSRKGMEPSDLDSSLVNCMCWSIELRCCRNSSVLDDFRMVRVSSTNPSPEKMVDSWQSVWPWSPGPPYKGWPPLGWWVIPWLCLPFVHRTCPWM